MVSNRNHFFRIFFWIVAQVVILNNIFLFDLATPYLYILPILLLPLNINRQLLLLVAFITGFIIDLFEGTGGIFAAATLIIAYLRPLFLRISFGLAYEQMTIRFHQESFLQKLAYASLMVFTHHMFLYSLDAFSLNDIIMILEKTIYSTILNIILLMTIFNFLAKNKKVT